MIENFHTINNYENYSVSNFGRVINNKTNRLLKPSGGKYLHVTLSVNNVQKSFNVHRLVAETFIGLSDKQVNHIDGDSHNNKLSNLEYVTASENVIHAYHTLGRSFNVTKAHDSNKIACKVIEKYNGKGYYFDSIREAEEYFKVGKGSFTRAINTQNGVMRKYLIYKENVE